jgi:hypothetical protein
VYWLHRTLIWVGSSRPREQDCPNFWILLQLSLPIRWAGWSLLKPATLPTGTGTNWYQLGHWYQLERKCCMLALHSNCAACWCCSKLAYAVLQPRSLCRHHASRAAVARLLDSRDTTTTTSSSSSSSSLVRVPQEVLLQVMRQLLQQDCLCSCASTCRSLLTAAGRATQEVQLCHTSRSNAVSQQQANALVAWLTKHCSSSLHEVHLHTFADRCKSPVALRLRMPWQHLAT